jgi:hypothetical protein
LAMNSSGVMSGMVRSGRATSERCVPREGRRRVGETEVQSAAPGSCRGGEAEVSPLVVFSVDL